MRRPFHGSPALLIALFAGLLFGLWSSRVLLTGGGGRDARDPAKLESGISGVPSGSGFAEEKLHSSTAPKVARVPTPQRDPLLESLRARLQKRNVVPGEALLTFRNQEARERFARQAAADGLQILDTIPQLNTTRVRYERIEDLRDAIAGSAADYASVEGNLWLGIPGTTSPLPDPNNQGGRAPFGETVMHAINAAGDRTQWGSNITVAVLDTGVLLHPTFAEGQITHLDLVNDGQSWHSHGTSVASLIGGSHPQAQGLATGARILDVRVANAQGYSISSTLAQGIIAAADRGAQVINISLGGYGESTILGQAVAYAFQRGAVVVAAAGNDGYGQLAIPAAYEGVISVGSVDAQNRQAYFSNAGAGLDLAAPGVGVASAWETNRIAFVSGTSQSAALVSAAVAAYLSWGVPGGQVAARLKVDARPAAGATGAAGEVGILMIKPPGGR
ncbi:hypothetical protein BH20VER1_BH20VER1_06480 [soil metagenome]